MDKIRVLQINAGSKNFGGVSAMILNLYRRIDKDRIAFDFLTPNLTTYSQFKKEIEGMGGRVFQFGINTSNSIGKIKLIFKLKSFLAESKYDIIHINSGIVSFNAIVAVACKRFSNAKIIVHSHNAGGRSGWKTKIVSPLKTVMERNADVLMACSKAAAKYMFTENKYNEAIVLKNGVDISKFVFDKTVRDSLRNELGIEDKFVIGHIGRFVQQKNHAFLVEVFSEIAKLNNNAVMLLIGQGELEGEVRQKIEQTGLKNKVIFTGAVSNSNEYYQAMDAFVLPSLFEGLPVVLIEAQISGLKCYCSDQITKEADISGLCSFLPLKTAKEWASIIMNSDNNRSNVIDSIGKAGYDINLSARELENIYTGLVGKC